MSKKLILKNGSELIIRKANKADSTKLLECLFAIGRESDYLEFGDNQWNIKIEQLEEFIEFLNSRRNSIIAIALLNKEVVGVVSLSGGERGKSRRIGEFSIGVRKSFSGLGIGSHLIKFLIQWAKVAGIIKEISLSVTSSNEKATKLYENHGFRKVEVQQDFYKNGEVYDYIRMILLIDYI